MPGRAPEKPAVPKVLIGPRPRAAWVIALLALGVVMWCWVEYRVGQNALQRRQEGAHGLGPVRWLLIAAAFASAWVPAVRKGTLAFLDRIRHLSPRALDWATFGFGFGATCYFVFTAFNQDRDLFPKTHDEGSYVIGLRMLARGRLWMDAHPLADFFDTFYVIVRPVYASLYFPGTALMYAPSDWLQWPTWLMPVVAAGACVALLYRVITELVDGAAGALAALLMVSLSWYRMLSVLVFAQVPLLLLALLLVWAWLRWRRSGGVGWALAMGAFAGWAAIVRPVDAVCYALPIGVAMLWELWRRPTGMSPSPGTPGEGRGEGLSQAGEGTRMRVLALPAIVLGALPFLSLQFYFNHGVTGRLTQTPYTFYLERDQPGTSFGFHAFDPSRQAESALPQKRDYYNRFMKPYIRDHQPGTFLRTWANKSLPMIVGTTLPARVLLVFVPVGVLGLTNIRSRVLWASLPLFVIGYLLNTFFLEHYAAVIIPAVLLSVVLGVDVLAAAAGRWRAHVLAGGVLVLVVIAVTSTYEFNPVATALDPKDKRHLHAIDDETFHSPLLRFAHEAEQMVERPAVILFRYTPAANIIEEPVYNTSVAWPDDAPVIRAHDLGPRNGEIFGYYAQRQPDRMFYRFDRATGTLTPLGRARDLAGAPATTRPTTGSAAR